MANPANPWIISKNTDCAIFIGPVLAAFLFLFFFNDYPVEAPYPLWVFIALVVSVDVAHVWATGYRVYLDPEETSRRPWIYLGSIPLILIASIVLHLYDSKTFWTVVAYYAIWHFLSQPYGFIAIYKWKYQERNPMDHHLDKLSSWVAGLGPILVWHATPERHFNWFDHGEFFLARIPQYFTPWILGIYGVIFLLYVTRQVQAYYLRREFNPGKQMVMLLTWLTWAVGIFLPHPLISAAFINLFHGIPFIALTWLYCHRKWANSERSSETPWHKSLIFLSRKENLFFFYALLLLPALAEEFLWDSMIWGVYLISPLKIQPETLLYSSLVGLLALPQLIHYYLDSHIWKLKKTNPDLKENLGLI